MPQQWEREIDELLQRREAKLKREPVSRRVSRQSAPMVSGMSGVFRTFLRYSPVEQFMIASLFLVAVAFLFSIIPSMSEIARWASLLSILFFVLALALSVASRRGGGAGPAGAKRWRDRDVGYGNDYGQSGQAGPAVPNVWANLQKWWRRRKFRRLQ